MALRLASDFTCGHHISLHVWFGCLFLYIFTGRARDYTRNALALARQNVLISLGMEMAIRYHVYFFSILLRHLALGMSGSGSRRLILVSHLTRRQVLRSLAWTFPLRAFFFFFFFMSWGSSSALEISGQMWAFSVRIGGRKHGIHGRWRGVLILMEFDDRFARVWLFFFSSLWEMPFASIPGWVWVGAAYMMGGQPLGGWRAGVLDVLR